METVAARFADDPDVATLYADARMNTMPWDYWQKDGSPKPETAKVLAMLESIIERTPIIQEPFTITSTCWRPPLIPIAPSEAQIGSAR